MTVLRNSLARCNARHLRIKRLVQFIFADPIYHNALTNCAALSCRALRRVARMCSRTVSGTAYRFRHGSTLCSPTEEKILCRSPFRSGRRSLVCVRLSNKGKVGVQRGRETAGVPSFLPPRWVPRRSRRPQTANPPAEVQRKTSCPERANTLTQFECPGQPVQKRSRPSGANTLTQFECPAGSVQKRSRPEGSAGKEAARRAVQEKVPLYHNKKLT